MNNVSLEFLAAGLRRNERLLGIDLGTKTIGLALSDVERTLATPYETIRRTKFANAQESAHKRYGKDFKELAR